GPAGATITTKIAERANQLLENNLQGVRRWPLPRALHAENVQQHDFITPYVQDLAAVIDMDAICNARVRIGVDPLGGAGLPYWQPIAERYGLDLTVVNPRIDPTFSFMTVDKDGQIRMDCSSPYAMAALIDLKDGFD